MCGIAGIYLNKNLGAEKDFRRAIRLMTQLQTRRGPDDKGFFESTNVFLGHNRLSIIDLSAAGHQPMIWQSAKSSAKGGAASGGKKQIVIVFNGEIYNFLELRKDLERKKYKFKTKTDTEVILALYAEYGEESFSKLRGMFAFALWDAKNQKLFLVKDRYGIKPLYYWSDDEKLIFASEVKTLRKSGLIPVRGNPKALIGFLLFGSTPLPITTVKGVLGIPAGHYLVKKGRNPEKLVKYYEPLKFFANKSLGHLVSGSLNAEDSAAVIGEARRILEKSVNLHLISDAPLGIFLSGGLDSSALAALAARKRKTPVTTLSIDFEEQEFSEKKYQEAVVRKIKSDHREIKITNQDFLKSFSDIFEAMDEPTVDGVNTFFIAKAAKEAGLKVVLSGLGSDEIFCGYPSFRRAPLLRKIQKSSPQFFNSLGRWVIESFLSDRYAKLDYFLTPGILNFYLGIRGLFAPYEIARILDIDISEVRIFLNELLVGDPIADDLMANLDPVDLLSYLELKFYLQNQLLKDTDFMSMYHSIEVRVPFLDHGLVEYASSLPSELKLNSQLINKSLSKPSNDSMTNDLTINDSTARINKPLLAAAVADLLPTEILARPKMGFTFPFEKWFREGEGQFVGKSLSHPKIIDPIVNDPLTNDLMTKFRAGKLHWSRFWALHVIRNMKS